MMFQFDLKDKPAWDASPSKLFPLLRSWCSDPERTLAARFALIDALRSACAAPLPQPRDLGVPLFLFRAGSGIIAGAVRGAALRTPAEADARRIG